jgi:hypothetical protein
MPLFVAAALASSARFFSITNNPEDLKYASMLAQHAIQLYNASVSILPYRSYQASVPSVLHTYASSGKYMLHIFSYDFVTINTFFSGKKKIIRTI